MVTDPPPSLAPKTPPRSVPSTEVRATVSFGRHWERVAGRHGSPLWTVRLSLALPLALASWALVGCGDAKGVDPTPRPAVTAAAAAVRLVDKEEANLVLYASIQSFDDVGLGGRRHRRERRLPPEPVPGRSRDHRGVRFRATLRESFEVPGDKPRFAVIDYWTKGDSTELT